MPKRKGHYRTGRRPRMRSLSPGEIARRHRNRLARRRRLLAKGYRWEYVGGGTMIQALGKKKFPCDDDYQHMVTGEYAHFATTHDAHFGLIPLEDVGGPRDPSRRRLPYHAKDLRELTRRPGVKLVRRYFPGVECQPAPRIAKKKKKRTTKLSAANRAALRKPSR